MSDAPILPDVLAGFLTREELARQIGRTTRTLERWESARTGPPITRIGKTPLYNFESVRAWLAAQEQHKPKRRASV